MTYVDTEKARRFVADIPLPIFQQRYLPVITNDKFSALIAENGNSKRRALAVASDLHDAGIPSNMLDEDAKIVDIAGHLLQMYIYYANRASC